MRLDFTEDLMKKSVKSIGVIGAKSAQEVEKLLGRGIEFLWKPTSFLGVEKAEFFHGFVPPEIVEQCSLRNGSIEEVSVIKAKKDIPMHSHYDPRFRLGEIYVGGDGGMVQLWGKQGAMLKMKKHIFSITYPGESHSLTLLDDCKEIRFLAIKFSLTE
ncbi:MAG: hypothetical protein OEV93_02995 [Candidatus Moranbacteria bacterium]|nr:hypothetical protein [Candidatus Moranbacteria bacterium]